MTVRQQIAKSVGEGRSNLVLRVMGDSEFLYESLPFVVGREGGKVKLRFSRLLFSFEDVYAPRVECDNGRRFVRYVLEGRRSRLVLEFKSNGTKILGEGFYDGPRGWVVGKHLGRILESLVNDAARIADKVAKLKIDKSDYSDLLASISWVSKLLMKSVLLRSELTMIRKGGLLDYVERLVVEKILQKYPMVYVSGYGDSGTFRILFVGGEVRGVYANIGGKEYVGDERILNEFEGVTRVKVYGLLVKPEEVLRR
ncbi:MAG TPA: hypothetical protein EYH17_00810 [Pyrodictium sp.]|nr:hypothetical protein [Pyrodictium sp.]